jgi:hypothetical protein
MTAFSYQPSAFSYRKINRIFLLTAESCLLIAEI